MSHIANKLDYAPPMNGEGDALTRTIAGRTRRVYDQVAALYPLSTMFFHSRAHRCALAESGIQDGMKVLEVATGSGEMFRRLVNVNRNGTTLGLDLSPRMAARTQRQTLKRFPGARVLCKAVDARYMPFRDESFDALVCCYLLELLGTDDILVTLGEFNRILRDRGTLVLVMIGQNTEVFNRLYRVCGRIAPAFWGRQVEQRAIEWVEDSGFSIECNRSVRQGFYPSRVLIARK
jgi:ubiquinone/menaquinone biosynthesis C-methylase UbiE